MFLEPVLDVEWRRAAGGSVSAQFDIQDLLNIRGGDNNVDSGVFKCLVEEHESFWQQGGVGAIFSVVILAALLISVIGLLLADSISYISKFLIFNLCNFSFLFP